MSLNQFYLEMCAEFLKANFSFFIFDLVYSSHEMLSLLQNLFHCIPKCTACKHQFYTFIKNACVLLVLIVRNIYGSLFLKASQVYMALFPDMYLFSL